MCHTGTSTTTKETLLFVAYMTKELAVPDIFPSIGWNAKKRQMFHATTFQQQENYDNYLQTMQSDEDEKYKFTCAHVFLSYIFQEGLRGQMNNHAVTYIATLTTGEW